MFHLINPGTNYDIVGKRMIWMGISIVGVVASLFLLATKGLNYGIDFTGGAEVQLKAPAAWNIHKLREELENGGIPSPRVQEIGDPSANEYLIRAQGDEKTLNQVAKQVEAVLAKSFKKGEYEIKRTDVVGPAAGSLLRKRGFMSMLFALVVILVYVGIRFDMRYAPGAVLALFHDTVLTLGIFVVTGKQFDLTILAALLALIGYSNNDTIIVFDRVRETLHMHPNLTIEKAVNRSINETLSRTLMTSLATFVVVLAIYLLGGSVIENFAFTFLIGIIIGAYSSIFVASSLVIALTHYQEKKNAFEKRSGKKKRREFQVRGEPNQVS